MGQSTKKLPRRDPAAQDGRVRRGARSRQVIVEALLELVGSGILRPTAQQVAARAGVGLRTVFRHFSDLESLYRAMDARVEGDVRPLLTATRPSGAWSERARGLARHRATFFERIAPFKRSGNLVRWRSRFLQDRHRYLGDVLRDDLLLWLPELGGAPADLMQAIELATSFEAWDALRSDRQLSVKQASAVVERSLLALLRDAKIGR